MCIINKKEMKKIVKIVFFGCNISSEPLKESLANELLEALQDKGFTGYIADEETSSLETYKTEVKAYQDWLEKVTEGFTESQRKNLKEMLDDPDYDKARIWSAKLEGMALILELTEEEVERIDANCYIGM